MGRMRKYIIIIITIALIPACKNHKKAIEGLQGKVKYEVVNLAPKVPGRIVKIFVNEGQLVKKGDTLAVLEASEITAKIQQADGAVESAQWQLDMAKNGATAEQLEQIAGQVEAAIEQVAFAEKSFQRMSNMFSDSLIPAQQFDEVRTKYEAAKAQLKSLEAKQAEIKKGARAEQIGMAKGQLDRAIGARAEAEQANKERYLIAPADMRIEVISLKVGELALPGYSFVTGYEKGSVYYRFTVSESKVNAYKVNHDVVVEVPYINKRIPCKIRAVKELPRYADNTSVAPNYKLGEAVFELKVAPNDIKTSGDLYQNSSVILIQ